MSLICSYVTWPLSNNN